MFVFKSNRNHQILEIDQLLIDKIKVEKVQIKNIEKVKKLSSDSEDVDLSSEDNSSLEEHVMHEGGSVGDDSTVSNQTMTVESKVTALVDEISSNLNTGASTPRNNSLDPDIVIISKLSLKISTSPLSQSELEEILAASRIGNMMLKVEVIFEKSTDFTASTLRKILPTRLVMYLKKHL